MLREIIILALSIPLLASTSQAQPATVITPPAPGKKSLTLPMNAGCHIVTENEPPFFVTKGTIGRDALQRKIKLANRSDFVDGYFKEGTIIKLDKGSETFISPATGGVLPGFLLTATVLSVPLNATSSILDHNTGRVIQGAVVGAKGQIRSDDLAPVVGGIQSPGQTIFKVTNDSVRFNFPELNGNGVRMAMQGSAYLTRRCCQPGVMTESLYEVGVSTLTGSKYYYEAKRHPQCTYKPVFELVKPDFSNPSRSTALKQFTFSDCDDFIGTLQAVDSRNLRALTSTSDALRSISDQSLANLQRIAYQNAIKTRYGVSGNETKGACKEAVNDTLTEAGLIPDRVPGLPARMMHPGLADKGFVNIMATVKDSMNAPVPSVLVYDGGKSGHVEIRVDEDSFCSDFCTDKPIDKKSTKRRLIGIYVPKGRK
ncbi:MAG TPA: hypothetical protein VM432_08570 [Bdellovibrionales bacterium]|jgi:hypothetical protein|nr:hypothetical protein [Bdellovibrionales bacterium]